MEVSRRVPISFVSGLCLLSALLVALARTQPAAPTARINSPYVPAQRQLVRFVPEARLGPVDQVLREAAAWRSQAIQAAYDAVVALQGWDPQAAPGDGQAAVKELLAADHSGYLRRALAVAQQASDRARTPRDEYQVAVLLAHVECELGHHQAELRQAHRLVELQPDNEVAWIWLRHAERCNARQAP